MRKFIFICISLMLTNALANENLSLLKKGVYKSLGYMMGYYRYGEFNNNGAHFMHFDTLFFGLTGQLGAVYGSGIKLEGTLRTNFAMGAYTGHALEVDNPDRYDGSLGQRVQSLTGAFNTDSELKAGYNFLRANQMASFYVQTGVGYYFSRTEFITMDRLQGYLYVPLEIEGELVLNPKVCLNYGGGYRHLIFGNHFSAASKYGVENDYSTTQRQGFGASAFIGANFRVQDGGFRQARIVYEYWRIGEGDTMRTIATNSGNAVGIHEPQNATHRIFLQYSFIF